MGGSRTAIRSNGYPRSPDGKSAWCQRSVAASATNCLSKADFVLLMGKKLDFSLRFGQPPFFSQSCRFIQIDTDASQLRTESRVVLTIHAEPMGIVRQLTTAAQTLEGSQREGHCGSWRAEVMAARRATPPEWEQIRSSVEQPIHPLCVCEALQPFLDGGAVFVSDGGEFGQWVQAGLEAEHRLINDPQAQSAALFRWDLRQS